MNLYFLTLNTRTSVYKFSLISYDADQENLFNSQELYEFDIIYQLIFIALMFDSGLMLLGEIRCLSLSGVNPLTPMCDLDKISP